MEEVIIINSSDEDDETTRAGVESHKKSDDAVVIDDDESDHPGVQFVRATRSIKRPRHERRQPIRREKPRLWAPGTLASSRDMGSQEMEGFTFLVNSDDEEDFSHTQGQDRRNHKQSQPAPLPDLAMPSNEDNLTILPEDITLSIIRQPFKLKAQERTQFLNSVFSDCSCKSIQRWRVEYEHQRKNANTLWDLVLSCRKTGPGKASKRFNEAPQPEDQVSHTWQPLSSSIGHPQDPGEGSPPSSAERKAGSQVLIALVPDGDRIDSQGAVDYCVKRLTAMEGQRRFMKELEEQGSAKRSEDDSSLECCICGDNEPLQKGCFCQGDSPHFACKSCMWNYLTKTERAIKASVTNVPCFDPTCDSMVGSADVVNCLGPLDLLDARERDSERSRRVALAGKQVFCEKCHIIAGVVMPEDVGQGPVSCPACQSLYCSRCGNVEHGDSPCPASKDMEQWLGRASSNTKRCPNCGVAVFKNGGCMHMTCQVSAGGCGHEFCWLCLGKYPRCNCGHFDQLGASVARQMQMNELNMGTNHAARRRNTAMALAHLQRRSQVHQRPSRRLPGEWR